MKAATGKAAPAHDGVRPPSWQAKAAKRVGWGLGDQALNSMTNFAVGILVAKSVTVADFGAYALAFSAYCFILGISRALASEPFAVRFTMSDPDLLRKARASVAGIALLTGLVFLAVAVALSQLIPAEYRLLVLLLGAVLPGLLLQDAIRQILFAAGAGRSAFNHDLLWTVLMVPAFGVVFLTGQSNAATLVFAWGTAATFAAAAGCYRHRVVPRFGLAKSWLQNHRGLWPRYLFEGAAINGSQQAMFIALGVFAGLTAVGEIKLVLVLLGPVNVLVQGLGVVAVPESARAIAAGRTRFLRVVAGFSLAVACGSLLWGVTVMLLPVSWGIALVGQGWLSASALVIPMSLVQVLNGANTGAVVGLRGLGAAKRSMWTRMWTSSMVVLFSVAGAAAAGGHGAAWGLAAAAGLNAVIWYMQFKKVAAQHPFATGGPDTPPLGGTVPIERGGGPR